MIKDIYEYRINKRGKEFFRTTSKKEPHEKCKELPDKPGIYTIQERRCRIDKYGCLMTDGSGRPLWTTWS